MACAGAEHWQLLCSAEAIYYWATDIGPGVNRNKSHYLRLCLLKVMSLNGEAVETSRGGVSVVQIIYVNCGGVDECFAEIYNIYTVCLCLSMYTCSLYTSTCWQGNKDLSPCWWLKSPRALLMPRQVRLIWGHRREQLPSHDPAAANLRDLQLKLYYASLKHTSFLSV